MGKICFAKFDIDNLPGLSKELGIRTLPAFFRGGEKRDGVIDLDVQGLDDRLKRLIDRNHNHRNYDRYVGGKQ